MKRHERTSRMIESFMELHNQGCSIKEIADQFSLSKETVYANLGSIAEQNNVTRDSLLKVVHSPHYARCSIFRTPVKPIDEGNFRACAASALKELNEAQAEIRKSISEMQTPSDKIGG